MVSMEKSILWILFSPLDCYSLVAFESIFFVSRFQNFNYEVLSVNFFEFILFGTHLAFWYVGVCFQSFIFFFTYFFHSHSPSPLLRLWWYECWLFYYYISRPWSFAYLFFFFPICFLSSVCLNSYSAFKLIDSSLHILILLLSPASEFLRI